MEYNNYMWYVKKTVAVRVANGINIPNDGDHELQRMKEIGENLFTYEARVVAKILGKIDTFKGVKHARRRRRLFHAALQSDPYVVAYLGGFGMPIPNKYWNACI